MARFVRKGEIKFFSMLASFRCLKMKMMGLSAAEDEKTIRLRYQCTKRKTKQFGKLGMVPWVKKYEGFSVCKERNTQHYSLVVVALTRTFRPD